MRDRLLSDAGALAARGLIEGARLSEIGKRTGYRNIAFDLLAMVGVLRERWPAIQGKTAAQLGELEQAEILADRLLTAVGAREQAPLTASAAAEDRQKAFTLFVAAYNELRRAVTYLRFHEGDADTLAPSLYAGRYRKRRGDETEAEPEPREEPTLAPPAAVMAPVAPGMPGGTPFVS